MQSCRELCSGCERRIQLNLGKILVFVRNSNDANSHSGANVNHQTLAEKFEQKSATVGVIGLGYVGLPLCLAFAEAKCKTLGFDIDPAKPQNINQGHSYLNHISSTRIEQAVRSGLLRATVEFDELSAVDAILICVPTPLTKHKEPDLTYVESTARVVAKHLRTGQLVVLESTTYPGTTTEFLGPILETSGLTCGKDFWLGFSPEREDPGNADFTTQTIPKVVGGDDPSTRKLIVALYSIFAAKVVEVSSTATAEAVKLTENIFRAINISLMNELKIVYTSMGIDIWEVVEAAKTKPFGFMPFYPGPGLGGHCVPIDPFYLSWKAREYNLSARFIELAGEINNAMPDHVVNTTSRALDAKIGRGLNGAKVLIVGMAYKKNIDDTRESPALRIMELLRERNANVEYYDPYIAEIPSTREHPSLAGIPSVKWDLKVVSEYDVVLIATDHDVVDYHGLTKSARFVVDTRNACARAGADLANVVPA